MQKLVLKSLFFFIFSLLFTLAKAQVQHGGMPKLLSLEASFKNTVFTLKMPSFNLDSLQQEDAINDKLKSAFRFGFNHFFNIDLLNNATVYKTDTGAFYFTKIKSNKAVSLNFAFNKFVLPKGCQLFMVSNQLNYLGSFNYTNQQADSTFATDILFSDEVIFEIFIPNKVNKNDVQAKVFRVTHGYRDIVAHTVKSIGDAGLCNTNINCIDGDDWQKEKRAVVCIIQNGNEKCTGTLINNTLNDETPYLLTANHCGVFNSNLWVFRFNYESLGCFDTPLSTAQSLNGAQVMATNLNSDFALLKLNTTPPASYNVYYAGWDRLATAPNLCTTIHHPNGDIKKISVAGAAQSGSYNSAVCWQTGLWLKGNTEPGSSGCALFNQNHKIVGQLYGGPSGCNVVSSDRYDYFGRFDQSWDYSSSIDAQLKNWLDPLNTGVTSLNGFAPTGIYSLTASLNRIRGVEENAVICSSNLAINFFLTNEGNTTITHARVNIYLDNVKIDFVDFVGSLERFDSQQIFAPIIKNLSNGQHTLKLEIESINSITSFSATEFSLVEIHFKVALIDNSIPIPFLDTFSTSSAPSQWNISSPNPFLNWTKNPIIGADGENRGCYFVDNFSSTQNIMGMSTYLYSPILNFSNANAPILLSFDVAYAPKNSARQDSLLVYASTDCGTSFKSIYRTGYLELATAAASSNFFVPKNTEWNTISISLDKYNYASNVQLLFENKSGWGNVIYLDNVRVDAIVGIEESFKNNDVQIFPNPASDEITINTNIKVEKFKIYNQLGQPVLEGKVANNNTCNISTLQNGIYFIEVKLLNGKSTNKKIVIANSN